LFPKVCFRNIAIVRTSNAISDTPLFKRTGKVYWTAKRRIPYRDPVCLLLRDLSLSMDSSIFKHIDGGGIYLVEPQFSQGFYPTFSIFQRIL
jgi:hypothetical protein